MIRSPGLWLSSTVAVAYPAELLGKAVGIMGEQGAVTSTTILG